MPRLVACAAYAPPTPPHTPAANIKATYHSVLSVEGATYHCITIPWRHHRSCNCQFSIDVTVWQHVLASAFVRYSIYARMYTVSEKHAALFLSIIFANVYRFSNFTALCAVKIRTASRGLCRPEMSVRPSVCLSVRHTPVFWRNGYTSSNFFSPSGSHTVLVFAHRTVWQYSHGEPPNRGVECKGVWKNRNFRPIPRKSSSLFVQIKIHDANKEHMIKPEQNSKVEKPHLLLPWNNTRYSRRQNRPIGNHIIQTFEWCSEALKQLHKPSVT